MDAQPYHFGIRGARERSCKEGLRLSAVPGVLDPDLCDGPAASFSPERDPVEVLEEEAAAGAAPQLLARIDEDIERCRVLLDLDPGVGHGMSGVAVCERRLDCSNDTVTTLDPGQLDPRDSPSGEIELGVRRESGCEELCVVQVLAGRLPVQGVDDFESVIMNPGNRRSAHHLEITSHLRLRLGRHTHPSLSRGRLIQRRPSLIHLAASPHWKEKQAVCHSFPAPDEQAKHCHCGVLKNRIANPGAGELWISC